MGLLTIVLGLGVLYGVRMLRNRPTIQDLVEQYVIVDVHAPQQWLQSHKVSLTWQGRTLPRPAVFRVRAPAKQSGDDHTFRARTVEDEHVEIEVAGRPVEIQVTPPALLSRIVAHRTFLLTDEGCCRVVTMIVVGTEETGPAAYQAPDEAETRKLIARPGRIDVPAEGGK